MKSTFGQSASTLNSKPLSDVKSKQKNEKIESEKTLEKLLKKLIEQEKRGWCVKLLSQHITGLPDRLCLMPGGRLFFAEVKTTKKKPTKIQKVVINKLINMGFQVEVLDTSEKIRKTIQDYAT